MKVIFLDFDGVLNPLGNEDVRHKLWHLDNSIKSKDKYGYFFDETCMMWLHYILLRTDAKMVVSSSWRWIGLEAIQLMWSSRNYPQNVHDITRLSTFDKRSEDIDIYIKYHKVDKYCIIDDIDMFEKHHADKLVITDSGIGIDRKSALMAVEILNN